MGRQFRQRLRHLSALRHGALIVDWGNGSTLGRSEYRIEADGDLRVEDFIQTPDGQWRSFALAELRRTE